MPQKHDLGSGRNRRRASDEADARSALEELLTLRRQLETVAGSPGVRAAHRLTSEVAEVLEPVWTVLAAADASGGVGYLRSLCASSPDQVRAALNEGVARTAIAKFGSINLVEPAVRDVWRSLARPSTALLESVRSDKPKCSDTADSIDRLEVTVRPHLPSLLLGGWTNDAQVVPMLRRVLCQWCDLARHASGERREVARLTLAAAMLARGAVLDGDTSTVRWFVNRWLGLHATESRVDGASAALLEDGWTYRSVDDEFSAVRDSVTDLRIEAAYQHRLHRPVWETQLAGASIGLLSELSGAGPAGDPVLAGTNAELEDPLTAATNALLKEQIVQVLRTFSERQATVIRGLLMDGKTRVQLQQELGLSRYRLKEIELDVMRKLRHPSRSIVLKDYQS